MNQKIIFFDIDGTLYTSKRTIPESTKKAIDLCIKNGHIVMLCTGRNLSIIPDPIRNMPFHGMIGGCGTYISYQNQVLLDTALTGNDCDIVLDALYRCHVPFFVENSDYAYYDETYVPETFTKAVATMNASYKGRLRSTSELPKRLSKITGYPETNADLEQLSDVLSPYFTTIIHKEHSYMEMVLRGYSKGTGIETILNTLQIPKEHSYAFGDSNNDIEMLDAVAHPMVMGNANETLKKRYPVTDSIFEDGIYHGLEKFGLI